MSQARADGGVTDERSTLTPRHIALIEAIAGAASRGNTISRELAGTAAGYAPGESARVAASRALALPHVRAALTKRLREMAQVDAASSLAVLRHLEMNAESERVRLDAALAGMRLGGLDAGDQQQTGAAVAVQIVFRTDAGTILTQAHSVPPQPQVISHVAEVEHSLAEGDAQRQPSQAGGEGQPIQRAKRGGWVKNRRRPLAAGPPAQFPPKKVAPRKKIYPPEVAQGCREGCWEAAGAGCGVWRW